MHRPIVVVLGAGYAGLLTVTHLQRKLGIYEAEIIFVNLHDYQYLTTNLHEPAAGTLADEAIQLPLNALIDSRKVTFKKGKVVGIDPDAKKVTLEDEVLDFDYLVAALGGDPECYDIPGLRENAYFISNSESVRQLRNHIEKMFEAYAETQQKEQAKLTFVVGGAGFTGIEFLCELADRIPLLCEKYAISAEEIKLICVEASSVILRDFDQPTVAYVLQVITRKGVELRLNCPALECGPDHLLLSHGEKINTNTIIWTGGIRGNSVVEKAGFVCAKGRVRVNAFLEAPGHPDIYVIGDASIFTNEAGTSFPPTAQIAIQQGVHCAKNILAKIRNRPPTPFVPIFRGMIMSLGKNNAAGIVFHQKINGVFASWMKKVIEMRYYWKLGGIKLVLKRFFLR